MAKNQKRGANRSQKSLGSENDSDHEIANRSPNPNKVQGPGREDVVKWHECMLNLEARVKAALGEDGLRKLSGLDTNIDPFVLAQIAARFAPQTYFQRGYQQALVKAALLLKEAQSITKDGPTIFSIPPELLKDFMWEKWSGNNDYEKIVEIDRIADPQKLFIARAKFITGQKRPNRAETDLYEYWGIQARVEGQTDVAAYKKEWRERLENLREHHLVFLNIKSFFSEWKMQTKSAKASTAGKKSRKKVLIKKS
jgi:hypothetical protein